MWVSLAVVFAWGVVSCSDSDDQETGALDIVLTKENVEANDISQFAKVVCDGNWTITFDYPEGMSGWCSTPTTSGKGNTQIVLNYTKNTAETERTVIVRLTSGTRTVSTTLLQKGTSGGDNPPIPGEVPRWLELPTVVSDPNCLFLTHYTSIASRRVRNFSLYFDTDERIACWVAYPLCSMYLGSQERTNVFQPDPDIPASDQMGATVPGYDRGHQIPSADRTVSENANIQTFYYSNMTPQLGKFNQNIWANLEGRVRTWARGADTLYVVTGAVLKTVGGSENITYATDRTGKRIAVPNYYFKVLLRLKFSGTTPTYRAIGFWFKHVANSGSVSVTDATTVDDIERKTGLDFFVNLPDDIETRIEAQFSPQEWDL